MADEPPLHPHCLHCVNRRCMVRPEPGVACDLLGCPSVCGAVFHRCKLSEHRLLCPDERLACINATFGCPFTLARAKMAAHLQVCPASIVCCTMEWNRWPVSYADRKSYECLSRDLQQVEQLDMALALQDQRMLLESLRATSVSQKDSRDQDEPYDIYNTSVQTGRSLAAALDILTSSKDIEVIVSDTGKERSPDSGTRRSPDSGTRRSPDSGTRKSPDSGTQRSPDSGTRRSPDSGTQRSPDSGTRRSPDSGTQRSPDSGARRSSDSGTQRSPDSGAQRSPDSGAQRSPDSGAQRSPDSGAQRSPDSGAQRSPDSGVQRSPDSGAQRSPDSGAQRSPVLWRSDSELGAVGGVASGAQWALGGEFTDSLFHEPLSDDVLHQHPPVVASGPPRLVPQPPRTAHVTHLPLPHLPKVPLPHPPQVPLPPSPQVPLPPSPQVPLPQVPLPHPPRVPLPHPPRVPLPHPPRVPLPHPPRVSLPHPPRVPLPPLPQVPLPPPPHVPLPHPPQVPLPPPPHVPLPVPVPFLISDQLARNQFLQHLPSELRFRYLEQKLQSADILRSMFSFNSRRALLAEPFLFRAKMEDKAVDTSDLEVAEDPMGLHGIDLITAALLFCLGDSPGGRGISDSRFVDGYHMDFGTQTFSFPSAILATDTMVGDMSSASACDHASPQLCNPSPFHTLRLDLMLECVARYQTRQRSMFTFVCAQLFRRDEFSSHFRNVHGDIHAGLSGWMEQRCPLAYYGCTFSQRRFSPQAQGARIIHDPHLGAFGLRPGARGPQGARRPRPSDQLSSLPFEVLQHVARFLDSFSLCQLSRVSHTMREVCGSLLQLRGMVVLLWERRRREDGRLSWAITDKVWRFSTAFGSVSQWVFADISSMADHLKKCSFNTVRRREEAVPLPCMCFTRELTREGRELTREGRELTREGRELTREGPELTRELTREGRSLRAVLKPVA